MTPEHCDRQIERLGVLRGMPADTYEYFAALSDIPDDRFTRAIDHALRSRQWFPTPAELRADVDAVGVPAAFSPPTARFEAAVGGGYEVTFVNPFNREHVITVKVDRIWKFDCLDCEDTGWRSQWCAQDDSSTSKTLGNEPGGEKNIGVFASAHCGRRHDHAAHEWVTRCGCIDWNPTIRRRKEAVAKYSHEAAKT